MAGDLTPTFTSLRLKDWRQFAEVDLRFHSQLTVLTGANAAGKTTLLGLLARHFGWETQLVGTPARRKRGGPLSFFTGIWQRRQVGSEGQTVQIGEVTYSDGSVAHLTVPDFLGPTAAFQVGFDRLQGIRGLFIPSHRPTFAYSPVTEIPTTLFDRQQILEQYLTEVRARSTGSHTAHTPAYRLKEALISMATFGYGNRAVDENAETVALFEGFVEILRKVLPPSLGFERLSIRMPEVVLETRSGDFPLDAVSGGVAAIIDLAFQIYMRDDEHQSFVVIVDEPENHLHPELQRTLLPGFLAAFPAVQFIVATHSPFVVGSVAESNVYVLRYESTAERAYVQQGDPASVERRVSSLLLDTVNKAGTSNQILRDVLGLEATIPLWAERELDAAVSSLIGKPLTADGIRSLRTHLSRVGLADTLPETLERIVQDDPSN